MTNRPKQCIATNWTTRQEKPHLQLEGRPSKNEENRP